MPGLPPGATARGSSRDSARMNDQPPPNKPPGKRGVNKATMDAPQEEFIDNQSVDKVGTSQSPDPSEAAPGGAETTKPEESERP